MTTSDINFDVLNQVCAIFDPGFDKATAINRFRRQATAIRWLNIWKQFFPQMKLIVDNQFCLELQAKEPETLLNELLYRLSKIYTNRENMTTCDIEQIFHLTFALWSVQKQKEEKCQP